jgi:hypothetical protein
MGAVKKVFKSVGKLIGLGGSDSKPVVQQQVVTPEPTPTVVTDVSADAVAKANAEAKKNKRRKGFASTQTATIAGESNSSGRSTLG